MSSENSYPDKYFTIRSTYLQGRPPKCVNMHWRRFAISDVPLEDQKEFDAWLVQRWVEKDQLLEECFKTGRFPSKLAGFIEADGRKSEKQRLASLSGYVETHVQLEHWAEVGQIFSVLTGTAVLYKLSRKLWSLWRSPG